VFAEAGVLPVKLSYELRCLAKSDFDGTLNGSWTGHPHRDPHTGELHGMSYYHDWNHVVTDHTGPGEKPGTLNLFLIDPVTGKTKVEILDDQPQEMPRMDDMTTRTADVVILHAQDLAAGPVATTDRYDLSRFGQHRIDTPRFAL
jgi:carotenoid cleavage dioxygenase-like enzyme